MSVLVNFEKKLIGGGTRLTQRLTHVAISALADYKARHLGTGAASVSFYAIFSVFPLLAFTVYFVGRLIGDESQTHSAPMVLKMLRDFVPAMQTWIEKGLFEVIKGNAVTSWVNALLLGWSGLGLFAALQTAVESLPDDHAPAHRSNMISVVLAVATLALFATFVATVVFCEMAGKSEQIPFWLQGLPFEVQDILFYSARSRALLGVMSVGIVMTLYKLLLPVKVSLRGAILGAVLFTGLMLVSRSAYWIYLHYNHHHVESTYGVFSTLILIMLWVHYCVNCLLYGCLFALHYDASRALNKRSGDAHGGDQGHGGSHDDGHGHAHAA